MKWFPLVVSLAACLALTATTWANDASKTSDESEKQAALVHVGPDKFKTPEIPGVTYAVVETPQGQALQVTSEQTEKPIILGLEAMEIEPGKALRCQYQVQAVSMDKPASIYLLMREHAKKDSRPFTPYHKISSHLRRLMPATQGQWVTRELSFTTTDKTHVLSGAIVLSKLEGTILISALDVREAQDAVAASAGN